MDQNSIRFNGFDFRLNGRGLEIHLNHLRFLGVEYQGTRVCQCGVAVYTGTIARITPTGTRIIVPCTTRCDCPDGWIGHVLWGNAAGLLVHQAFPQLTMEQFIDGAFITGPESLQPYWSPPPEIFIDCPVW